MRMRSRLLRASEACLPVFFALELLLCVYPASGDGPRYGPVKVPMIPGIKEIVRKVTLNLVKPNLKDAGGDWLLAADLTSESVDGASNYATSLSNGRLFVAVSPWADLTVFRWPNPTYSDHLRYFTFQNSLLTLEPKPVRTGDDSPSADWKRYGHPIEPCPGLGSSGGVLLGSGGVVWTSDPVWTTDRSFDPEDTTILVTTLTSDQVKIKVSDWVQPDRDLMVRNFAINGQAHTFFYHSTFSPWSPQPGGYAESDPRDAGFGAIYLPSEQAMVHFQPRVKDTSRSFAWCQSAADLDIVFPEGGIFVSYGFAQDVDGFQVGADRCREQVPDDAPLAGKEDAQDGTLNGDRWYLGPVDSALSRELDPEGETSTTVLISVSDSASGALEILEEARDEGVDVLRTQAAGAWQEVSDKISMPQQGDPVTARVIGRSLLNLIQGQDRESGAIVASISRQPHYHFDWPRDGAFFDLSLDLAGFPEAVTRHHGFYKRTQYTAPIGFCLTWLVNYRSPWYKPAGHWPSNMAVDGSQGSIMEELPFEIDETALLVWDFWRHERSLSEPARAGYREEMKMTLEQAADALLDYVDEAQGWTLPAVEDDNFPPDATLHGVASVLTGLASACDAGPRWGIEQGKTEKWCNAATSLRAGVKARIMDPEIWDAAGWRGTVWTLWPAPVFEDYGDPGAAGIKDRIAESIQKKIDKQRPGFGYLGEEIFILALADRDQAQYHDLLERALTLLTHEVAFEGTDCYGEVTLWGDFSGTGEKVAQQRTSIPHIWTGVTAYLAAMAIYDPERFDLMRPPAP